MPRERGERRERAAQPPERSARGEAKRRGGAAAHKRRERSGEGKKKEQERGAGRWRRSRHKRRVKERQERGEKRGCGAAQPP